MFVSCFLMSLAVRLQTHTPANYQSTDADPLAAQNLMKGNYVVNSSWNKVRVESKSGYNMKTDRVRSPRAVGRVFEDGGRGACAWWCAMRGSIVECVQLTLAIDPCMNYRPRMWA